MTDPDLVIVGGGVGGCAAALSACSLGLRVVMTEPTNWVGGQLTSQCVPPDEHPWIEEFGCTARYRDFRNRVRRHYRSHECLAPEALDDPALNPGRGWVSRLCCRPDVAHRVLREMLQPAIDDGLLEIVLGARPVGAETDGDRIAAVGFVGGPDGEQLIRAPYFLDATETGELLALSDTEYVCGAESRRDTDEPHAVDGDPEPDNVQSVTWCAAVGYDPDGRHSIQPPGQYGFWADHRPENWPGNLLSFKTLHAQRGEVIEFPLFGNDGLNLFSYRQIVDGKKHTDGREDATVMNWPMNDYCRGSILGVPEEEAAKHLNAARQLTLSMLYWLQTEAPRHNGGTGYPELRLRPDLTGTEDGLAMAPYIRESRRISAEFTVKEQHVSAEWNP
ncbi:MAG: FAD-dependent oxidoreductase, partial [Armatimonadetes bacterium]|nr:FAD-dependent oxidoreductase [Armatimonadota bacterium]